MAETTRGFSYPDGSDPWTNGADQIEALATSVDDYHGVGFWATRASQSIPNGGVDTAVIWTPGTSDISPEFAFSVGDTTLTYTGPTRWFTYDFRCTWEAGTIVESAALYLNGAQWDVLGTRGQGLIPMASGYYLNVIVEHGSVSAKTITPQLMFQGL